MTNLKLSRCLCPAGRGGPECMEEVDIATPSLSGLSYLALPTLQEYIQTLTPTPKC